MELISSEESLMVVTVRMYLALSLFLAGNDRPGSPRFLQMHLRINGLAHNQSCVQRRTHRMVEEIVRYGSSSDGLVRPLRAGLGAVPCAKRRVVLFALAGVEPASDITQRAVSS